MSAEETLKKLNTEPLYLAKVIVYNNSQAVAANLQELTGYNSSNTAPEDVLQAFFEALPQLTTDRVLDLLDVDFNLMAGNETANYLPVLEMQHEVNNQQGNVATSTTWAGTFAGTVQQIQSAYLDFVGSPETEQTPAQAPEAKPKKPCCTACARKEDARKLLLIVGGGLLVLVAIITLFKKS